jgi:hypothetical protein
MTLYEFNPLDINNQMETVNQQGVYLDKYINKNGSIFLSSIIKRKNQTIFKTEKISRQSLNYTPV